MDFKTYFAIASIINDHCGHEGGPPESPNKFAHHCLHSWEISVFLMPFSAQTR